MPDPVEAAPPRALSLQPLSAALIALGVALPTAPAGGMSWVAALPALLLLPSLLDGPSPRRAALALGAPPALIGALVGSLRWENTLVIADAAPYTDPAQIGGWALEVLPQGERGVGGLLLGGALGLLRLRGRPAAGAAAPLALCGGLALAAELWRDLAAEAFTQNDPLLGDLALLLVGPALPAALALGLLGAGALRRAPLLLGAALGCAALAFGGLLPAPRLSVALAAVAPADRADLPVGARGPALAGAPIPYDHTDMDAVLRANRRAFDPNAAWSCRRFDRRWHLGARAAELIAAPADLPVGALRPAVDRLRAWSVDRLALQGRVAQPPSALDRLTGAAPLWSRPTARLLLDAPPEGAAWIRLGPAGVVGAPPTRTDDSPRLDCVIDVQDDVTVQQLYTVARELTEGPAAPCRALAWAPTGASPEALCPKPDPATPPR
ncbi:MAG: hypothetical protein JNM72_17815 [Deltaproteobacteria bacterium]|nr:hypothetical protein [Deltaproteobacteria bacterium]